MAKVLGIDLGTTYSAMAFVDEHEIKIIPNKGNNRITPSVVYFEKADNIIVGQNAKEMMGAEPEKVVSFIKREMGKKKNEVRKEENNGVPKPYEFFGNIYSPEEISSYILKKLKNDAQLHLKQKYNIDEDIKDVIITVPAYFGQNERMATIEAGKLAGLNVLQVINEPTAAAISYRFLQQSDKNEKVFVFDLGGGTFDVTVLDVINENEKKETKIISSDGDHRLGGKDWDDKIIEYAANEFISQYGEDPRDDVETMADLREKTEKLKIRLSESDEQRIVIKAYNKTLRTTITREKFEELTVDLMSRIEALCEAVLIDTNLQWQDIDTIVLAGGSTRMPMVQNLLKKISGKEIRTDLVQPDECVAIGAAIASITSQVSKPIPESFKGKITETIDNTNKTFGIIVVTQDGKDIVDQMIKKNTPLPHKFKKEFGTHSENAPNIFLQITEGESTNPNNVTIIKEATFPIINPLPAGSPIEITFNIDTGGMLTVTGKDIINNQEIIVKVEGESNLTGDEFEKASLRSKSTTVS